MARDRVLVIFASLPPALGEALPIAAALNSLGEDADYVVQAEAQARTVEPSQSYAAPRVVVVLPQVRAALQLARTLRAAWPDAHLLLAREAAEIDAFRQGMGIAPMLGRHWSLVEGDSRALANGLRQALSSSRRRVQLRTTLATANARLVHTRAIAVGEYQRLIASEHHLANFLRYSDDAVVGLDKERRVLFWSQGAAKLLGTGVQEALGRTLAQLGPWTAGLQRGVDQLAAGQSPVTVEELVELGGEQRAVEATLATTRDESGTALGTSILLRDVTARRRAQDQLREANLNLKQLVSERTRELEQSQLALIQAQKLEAIGKLTGGVAHDFNNVLQIIGSNLQLLQPAMQSQPDADRFLCAAQAAVDRGAKLSSQLLAFARRHPLTPVPLNIARRVREMDDLLQRALGEDIEVDPVLEADLWTTLADANQLENVILNLAINSRDAMPHGGKLTISARNTVLDKTSEGAMPDIAPGPYVLLAISDTGHGMPPEVAAQAFEPFFTTKPEGKGTGLGLSMAYGFAKQSGGHICIQSKVGAGTTISLYLPRSHEKEIDPPAPLSGPVRGGTETILVVEDDLAVQAAAANTLQTLGYRVLRANDGQAALSILRSGMPVDLLFTDVVMPGPLRSHDLARHAQRLLPGIAVLFTSGYTQNALVHGGRLDAAIELISKPYRQHDLARKVRHLLGNQQQVNALKAALRGSRRIRTARPAPGGALRVLLVDDQSDVRETSQQMLELLGCQVEGAPNAEAAEAALKDSRFDVLVTDISLPGRSGLALAEEAESLQPGIKVVLSSGYAQPLGQGSALPGFVGWNLPKPYGLSELEALLQQLRPH
jgi:PAS domain S-box-containing protein